MNDANPQREKELLELENARLRKRLKDMGGDDNPNFDPYAFQQALAYYSRLCVIPAILLPGLLVMLMFGLIPVPELSIGPIQMFDMGSRGFGLGIIAMGGVAFGGIAMGGGAVGVIATGGGALGIVAIGGGAVGVIAVGGGAVGVFAIGGGGYGYYVLAGQGNGKYVFSLKRQDPEAVAFWTRFLPRLRNAVTSPLPVIPVEDAQPPRSDGFA